MVYSSINLDSYIERESKKKTNHCSVHFDSSVTIIQNDIQKAYLLHDEDILWYDSNDMTLMQMSAYEDAISNQGVLQQEYCIDVNAYTDHRREQKQEAIYNVLLQQELLWDDEVNDPELIAEVYMENIESSQIEATQRGIRHAKHVFQEMVQKDETSDITRTPVCRKTDIDVGGLFTALTLKTVDTTRMDTKNNNGKCMDIAKKNIIPSLPPRELRRFEPHEDLKIRNYTSSSNTKKHHGTIFVNNICHPLLLHTYEYTKDMSNRIIDVVIFQINEGRNVMEGLRVGIGYVCQTMKRVYKLI